jgi:hypothetical protein
MSLHGGDLIRRYVDQAAIDDRKRKVDNTMPPMVSVFDALSDAAAKMASEGNPALSELSGGAGFNFDAATKHLANRAMFQGLPDINHFVNKARAIVNAGLQLCESPIEKRLLPWLVCEDYGPHVMTFPIPICDTKADALPPSGDLFIVPQMAFVRFRIDFALVRRLSGGRIGIVAVECDGKDYHDAVRDTLRNGWLASFQIKTIRANGSTIANRPREVSARVAEAVMELGE